MRFLLPLVLLLPVFEIVLFIKIGAHIGYFIALGILVLIGVLGTLLLRQQGFSTLLRFNQRLQLGDIPTQEVVSGLVLALGALLLVIPGFFTDVLALACLIPPTRYLLVKYLLQKTTFLRGTPTMDRYSQRSSTASAEDIIEGEFMRDGQKRLEDKT